MLKKAIRSFSSFEKIIFWTLGLIFIISALTLLWRINNSFLVEIPKAGGQLSEGIVGYPHLVNPLFAVSSADKDVASLVYSGLMKVGPDGKLIPDLAKDYSISSDGKTYTFNLKDNITFHDGQPITTDDIEFTIQKATDPSLNSPKRANWTGVTITKNSPTQITFTLKQPYTPFLENTTMGILPKHLWKNIANDQFTLIELNAQPVGSGPYKIDKINRSSSGTAVGIPLSYELSSFDNYALGKPLISNVILYFYSSEESSLAAYKNGEIESLNTFSPQNANLFNLSQSEIKSSVLPRTFGVFFNQNQSPVLAMNEVRQALNISVDRQTIIQQVLNGYGVAITGPLPVTLFDQTNSNATTTATTATTTIDAKVQSAKDLLAKNGWKLNTNTGLLEKKVKKQIYTLEFSLSTSNASDLMKTADLLKNQWQKIGAKVDVKIYEPGDLNQTILRPRKYDALLFGEVTGRDLDLYAFWHSSQRNDPGLNIAMYTNSKADKLLEQARTTLDPVQRITYLQNFNLEIQKDTPAVFLYSPDFIYVIPKKLHNFSMGTITSPEERFAGIENWYINTEKVWKIFIKKINH
jgi:peptide/nickel transport system substrate-binding protein